MRKSLLQFIALSAVSFVVGGCGNGGSNQTDNNTSAANPASGYLSLLAGKVGGQGNLDGVGVNAAFDRPDGIALDGSGNLFVADTLNNTVRKVTPAGVVSTLAGGGSIGYGIPPYGCQPIVNGVGAAAVLCQPTGIVLDSSGNVYVSEPSDIRKITPSGVVSVLAGGIYQGFADGTGILAQFEQLRGLGIDANGNLYAADCGAHAIRKITPAGVVTTFAGSESGAGAADGVGTAAQFDCPTGVTVDSSGFIYVTDVAAVRKITPSGIVTTLAGNPGTLGSADGSGAAATFHDPGGITVDSNGDLYVVDINNSTVRKVTASGDVTTFAGTAGAYGTVDGVGAAARFDDPKGVVVDGSGDLYVTDTLNNTIRKLTPNGTVTTLAGSPTPSTGNADGLGPAASFKRPVAVATDSNGNTYVADNYNETIRKISSVGVVSTLAGTTGVSGSTNGSGSAALFNLPNAIAVDGSGNVYVADQEAGILRKITADGTVSALAAIGYTSFYPMGLATDQAGNIYMTTGNNLILKMTPTGTVTTVAGNGYLYFPPVFGCKMEDGPAATSQFCRPQGIAVDNSGNIYVADTDNLRIRKITPSGIVSTLAGSGLQGSIDGLAATAEFSDPAGLAVDAVGNVYVADTTNDTIRKISPDGTVSTLVGETLHIGFSQGALPGGIDQPMGIAMLNKNAIVFTSEQAIMTASGF